MADPTRPRPTQQSQQAPVALQRVNTNRNISGAQAQGNGEARGLIEGLSAFNPALARFATEQYNRDVSEVHEAAARDGAAMELDPNVVNNVGEDSPLPPGIPAAFGPHYFSTLRSVVAKRVASKSANDLLLEYQKRAQDPEFNSAAAEAFVKEWKDTQYAGILDKEVLGELAVTHNRALEQIRQNQRGIDVARIKERATTEVGQLIQDRIKGHMTGEEAYNTWANEILPAASELKQHSQKELAALFIGHLMSESDRLGGMPELFDAVDQFKDAEGFTIAARTPEQADNVNSMRAKAAAMRDKRLKDGAADDRVKLRMTLDDDLRADPRRLTDERLLDLMGGLNGLTEDEVLAYRRKRDQGMADAGSLAAMDDAARNETLMMFPTEQQKKYAAARLAPLVQTWQQAVREINGLQDPAQQEAAIRQITGEIGSKMISFHSGAGSNVPNEAMKNLFDALTQQMPGKDAQPSVPFRTAAAIYRALPQNLQDVYASADARTLMRQYNRAIDGEASPQAALVAAYRAIDPATKAAMESRVKDPEFQKRIDKAAQRYIAGSTRFVPDAITKALGWSVGANTTRVGAEAAAELRSAMLENPDLIDDEGAQDAHIESWLSRNYVNAGGTAIRVPAGVASEQSAQAIQDFLETNRDKLRTKDRNDARWGLTLEPVNLSKGTYRLMMTYNGQAREVALGGSEVTLDSIMAAGREKRLLTDVERATLGTIMPKLRDGSLSVEDREAHKALLDKVQALGLASSAFQEDATARARAFRQNRERQPRMDLGAANHSALATVQKPVKIDHAATAQAATQFLNMGGTRGTALALITMGEAMVLQRYPDPAKGDNIAMGYSLTANAKTAKNDLKRAKVPDNMIEDVIAGRAALTMEQAMRLTEVAYTRYEHSAAAAANNTAPGLWDRLNHKQRAVLVDVAWQTGDPAQFTRALKSLVAGDMVSFKDQIKVRYRDRKTGEMKEDVRRNNLRASLLDGTFGSAIREASRIPSTRLAALN